jgi:hypothetical protein
MALPLYRGVVLVMSPCPYIGALCWSCRLALVSGRCAGHAAPPLYRGVALVLVALPLYRGVALVLVALPLYWGVALVLAALSLYRLLCARHWWCVGVSRLVRCRKVSNFLQGIKRSDLLDRQVLLWPKR